MFTLSIYTQRTKLVNIFATCYSTMYQLSENNWYLDRINVYWEKGEIYEIGENRRKQVILVIFTLKCNLVI